MDLPFSTEDLTRLYRFALLLMGDESAAQQVLYDACAECSARLASCRNDERRLAFMLANVRQRAKDAPAAEGRGIAKAFSTLPEEERAALSGLYSGLLPARELAEALKISLDDIGRILKSARERLGRSGSELGEATLEQAL